MPNESCRNCHYCRGGECRYYPPVLLTRFVSQPIAIGEADVSPRFMYPDGSYTAVNEMDPVSDWPRVDLDGWCGKWENRDDGDA